MRPKRHRARPEGLPFVLSIPTDSCPCCNNQRVFGFWPQLEGPGIGLHPSDPGEDNHTFYSTSLSCMWTQICSALDTVFQVCTISSGEAQRYKMPPDVKLQGSLPGFWLLKWVLLQGAGKGRVVNEMRGFQQITTLAVGPVLEQPSLSALSPNHHQQWALLEKLGTVGTFTQISSFMKYSLPRCGFSCYGDWFVFNELMLLVEIFLGWVMQVSFGKIHMEILPSRSAPD